MTLAKSCPGASTIRQPIPEYVNCPNCGKEVEIWTDELRAICPGCGNKVFREHQVSCIDWCPYAKECVGAEVYERLRPGAEEYSPEANTPLDILKREHDRVLENLSLLRGASLCLRLGNLAPRSAIREKGIEHLSKVLDFFNKDVGLHFRREEEVLFPALEKHLGVEKSPTRLLLGEHGEVWRWYDRLKEKLVELQGGGNRLPEAVPAEVQNISSYIERLLREHIKKEDESLFPLARSLLSEKGFEEISTRWKSLSV